MEREQRQQNAHGNRITVGDIAEIGVMSALIEVSKLFMQGIPNVELTSFWLIMFTLYFGKKVFYVIPVFILLEGLIYGFGLWWIMYLYVWPLLVCIIYLLRKKADIWCCSLVSAIFGFGFGLLCSVPYFFMGLPDGGIAGGVRSAVVWFIAGIRWDIVHGISNFVIMLILYTPIQKVIKKIKGIESIK